MPSTLIVSFAAATFLLVGFLNLDKGSKISSETLEKAHPYLVFVNQGNYACEGSIISESHILTAAHCVCLCKNKPAFIHRGGKRTRAHRIICHEQFNKTGKLENDIAILALSANSQFRFDDYQEQSVPLRRIEPNAGDLGFVIGRTKSEEMRAARVEIKPFRDCRYNYGPYATDATFCVDGFDVCFVDSGGPLIIEGNLTGILFAQLEDKKCEALPRMFTSVAHHRNWIEQKMTEPVSEDAVGGFLTEWWDGVREWTVKC